MYRLERIKNVSTLLSVTIICAIVLLTIPVIIPHLLHGFHAAHLILHTGGIALASFIAVLAIVAYLRTRTKRLAFSAAAFVIFMIAQTVMLVETAWPSIFDLGFTSMHEVGHLLIFTSLGLLAVGVLKND